MEQKQIQEELQSQPLFFKNKQRKLKSEISAFSRSRTMQTEVMSKVGLD